MSGKKVSDLFIPLLPTAFDAAGSFCFLAGLRNIMKMLIDFFSTIFLLNFLSINYIVII